MRQLAKTLWMLWKYAKAALKGSPMKTRLAVNPLFNRCLRRDQFLRFEHPRGLRLRAERGALWVTVDGEPDDITIEPGDCRVFSGDATVLVSSFGGESCVSAALSRQAGGWRGWLDSARTRVVELA